MDLTRMARISCASSHLPENGLSICIQLRRFRQEPERPRYSFPLLPVNCPFARGSVRLRKQ